MATHIKGTQVYAARESSTATIRQNAQRNKNLIKADFDRFEQIP